jgi:sugar O-acyltransferase (sialic acid O-acetyltransferase NeuD family)
MNIIIVGSGAVAAELTSYIKDHNKHTDPDNRLNILGYLDSAENIPKYWAKYKFERPVVGDAESYAVREDDRFIVGISNIPFREQIMAKLMARGARIIGFTHYNTIIADSAVIGSGNIIYPNCIIGPNTVIGNNNLLTAYSFISHDCTVGDSNFLSTAGLSGNVRIGNYNYFGIRATVLPHVSIGNNNTIQAGMIVDKDVADNTTVFHRFKEKVMAIKSPSGNE